MKEEDLVAICFGEVLFDLFPTGSKPGGAPMNVAIHLQNLGISTGIISAVGKDQLGDQLLEFLKKKKVNTSLIQTHPTRDTGTVRVNVDTNDNPTYTILEGVAWDYISDSFMAADRLDPKYILHGTLACRSTESYLSLNKLLNKMNAKVVLDLNIRSPFYSKSLIDEVLGRAHIVKMNEEELELLRRWFYIKNPRLQGDLKALRALYPNLETIILTLGAKGSMVWHDGKVTTSSTPIVKVVDTVGSGDAFLGGFLSYYERGKSIEECLTFASATGAYVATQEGANPSYTEEDVLKLLE